MKNIKQFFTYLVVGALVMALSVSCKSNEEAEGEVNIGQYAGTYTSDNKAYGKDSGQYFVLRVNSDNIECSVSDNQTMSTVAITFSKFTKTGEGIYASESGSTLVDAVLNFSGNSLTYEASSGQRIMLDDTGNNFIFTVEQIGQPFTMTKVN